MKKIFSSNHLERLCQTLAESIGNPQQDVFQKDIIITQNTGMDAWLKTELAQRNGVFANFEFQKQDSFYAAFYQLLFGEPLRNNVDIIKYKIYQLLDGDFKDKFTKVSAYYQENPLRRFQLAERIADLFDQYQLYRPEMIEGWENGKIPRQNSAEEWQCFLWKELGIASRGSAMQKMVGQLDVKKDLIKETYPVITLFGISAYTRFHLEFFTVLSEFTEVNFYVCLPTNQREYQNDLLANYGAKARELANMLDIENFAVQSNVNDTLLARIQNQVLTNTTDFEFQEDDSLRITSSYTPVREVEALYNYLLDLFEKDRQENQNNPEAWLKPGDILVIATDINKYAPFIKAVFRNVPVPIPFKVSGAANNSEDSITSAIELLLNFTTDDMTSEKVVSLLEQKRISKRFGIQDCNYIRSIVRKANIRFGIENRAEDDTRYVSWKYGLEKILLGYAMLTDEEYEISEGLTLYPFKDSEASKSYDLFRLKAFVEKLENLLKEQATPRSLADWKKFLLEEVAGKMVYRDDFDKTDRTEFSSIYRALTFIDQLELDAPVPFSIFLEELKSKLFTESRESRLNTGCVTVSSPVPVRGLPFKVICFLGLNNDIFPRKESFMGFDLLGEEYRVGDRNKKETDKYLFLDTILAAREKLYLSYIGQSVKDNTGIPPSIVIDTLLDYIGLDNFVVNHPLHGFSSAYNKNGGKGIFTYLYGDKPGDFESNEIDPKEFNEISVDSFVKFFEHPIEWYFKNVLGISYDDNEDTLPETELFELDNLQKWVIKNDLLTLSEDKKKLYLQKGIKEGLLPLRNLGERYLEKLIDETAPVKSKYINLTKDQEEKNIHIALTIDDIRITGTIKNIYTRKYITCSFSKTPQKNLVRAYIRSLLLGAQNEIDSAILINNGGQILDVSHFPADVSKSKIKELLVFFKKGIQSPLKFTLKATQPPNHNTVLSIGTVLDSFNSEAEGNRNIVPPVMPSWYMKTLIDQGYFINFTYSDFEELTKIAGLLNLNAN